MIAFLNPAALLGLLAVALPIAVHLLRQPKATRVAFPTLRFVQPSTTIAARLRRLSDVPLLAVRVAIVALAALAFAQPVLLTEARMDAWNTRVVRAIVVDGSPALARGGADVAARAAAAAEQATAYSSTVFEAHDLGGSVGRAAAWLATSPPARRELVVISDFRHGALPPGPLPGGESGIGVRTVAVGAPLTGHRYAQPRFGAGDVEVQLTASGTMATLRAGDAAMPPGGSGALAPAVAAAVAQAGTPAGDPRQPLAFSFRGETVPAPAAPVPSGWMLGTVLRMTADDDLRRAADDADDGTPSEASGPWTAIVRGPEGQPLVRAAAAGETLWIDVAADANSFLAAAAVRAALVARGAHAARDEEIARVTDAELAALSREAAPVGREAVEHVDRSDARWIWAIVLLLLAAETWLRRAPAVRVSSEAARAA